MSFSYALQIVEGNIHIGVKVVDDHVILKDSKTIVSDHVAIWLADPRLIGYSSESNVFLKRDLGLEEDMDDLKKLIETTLKKYETKYFCSQFIFNKNTVFLRWARKRMRWAGSTTGMKSTTRGMNFLKSF